MKKNIKQVSVLLGSVLLLLVIAYVVLSIYVNTHKKELITKATKEIGFVLGGTVSVSDISVSLIKNFPSLSLDLQKTDICDSAFAKHGHSLLYAENIILRVNPLKLLVGNISLTKIEINDGRLYLYTDSSGYTNSYLLNPKTSISEKKGSNKSEHLFEKVALKNVNIVINDLSKNKLFDFAIKDLLVKTKQNGDLIALSVSESLQVRSLAFNTKLGSYLGNHLLIGDFVLNYNIAKQRLVLIISEWQYQSSRFYFPVLFLLEQSKLSSLT